MIQRLVTVLCLVCALLLARAANATTYTNMTITQITVDAYGNLEIAFNQTLCTGTGGGYNQIVVAIGRNGITADSLKSIQSFATAAYLAGKKVYINVNNPSVASQWYCDWAGMSF